MGAINLDMKIKATTSSELKSKFRDICEQSRYENGSQYSGDWGMKHDVKVVSTSLTDENDIIEFLEKKADKWDDALAVKFNENEYIVVAICSC